MTERWHAFRRWLADRPRPKPVHLLKAAPFVVVAIALLVLMGRNWDTVDFPEYSAPEGFVVDPPATTLPPDFERPSLIASVAGTTTTIIPDNVGRAHLMGSVASPAGPLAGATVRIERAVGGQVQVTDVLTDPTGRWDAPNLGGGRYRVRAFLPPTLTQRTAEVFILGAEEERNLDLVVEAFSEPSVSIAIAPDPAILDQQLNVVIRITGRFVDADGFVSIQPLVGGSVDVETSFGWRRNGPGGPVITDSGGHAVVNYTCDSAGAVQVEATVRAAPGVPAVSGTAVFECVDPATLTTTTVPGTGGTFETTSTTIP